MWKDLSPFFVHYSQSGYYIEFPLLRLGKCNRCTKIIFNIPEAISLLWVFSQSLFLAHSVMCHTYQFVLLTHLPVPILWGKPGLLWWALYNSWHWIMLCICEGKWTDLKIKTGLHFVNFFPFLFSFSLSFVFLDVSLHLLHWADYSSCVWRRCRVYPKNEFLKHRQLLRQKLTAKMKTSDKAIK